MQKIFTLFNSLYKSSYWLYKPLYFFYKKFSDKSKIVLLKDIVKPGMHVLDIGANIGYYTILLSELVGENGKVYAFEPDETNFKHLSENTKNLKNVSLFKKAVGNKTETIKLYYSDELNVDHQTYDSGEGRKCMEIDAIAIDDIFKKEQFNFIKLDIQGFDYYALQGMTNTLDRSQQVSIFGEFWPYALEKAGSNYKAYLTLLEQCNFDVKVFEALENNNYDDKINDKSYYTDFLASKSA